MTGLLLFGGTTEGRVVAREAAALGYEVTLCVATPYGRQVLSPGPRGLTVRVGRMDGAEMEDLMASGRFAFVVDATHPYAVVVSGNIRRAARGAGLPCLRLAREESRPEGCLFTDSVAEACALAGPGNLLAATGSKEIVAYAAVPGYRERVYARVLPTDEAVAACRAAGLSDSHIRTGRGPFTQAENAALLREWRIRTMITKDGGGVGGFGEKLAAAEECGVQVIVVRRPAEENGLTMERILTMLREGLG